MLIRENFYMTSFFFLFICLSKSKKKLKRTQDMFLLWRLLLKFYSKHITKFPILSEVMSLWCFWTSSNHFRMSFEVQELRKFCRWKLHFRIHMEDYFYFTLPFSAQQLLAENKQEIPLICLKSNDGSFRSLAGFF